MNASLRDTVDRKLAIAITLNEGGCGGSYYEATLLLSSIVSGIAADVWPGEGIDRKRFIELWVRYADPALDAVRISVPLLVTALNEQGKQAEAAAFGMARPVAYALGQSTRVVVGTEVDASEAEVLAICPGLAVRELRGFAYPNAFYRHVRSTLVHEYHLGESASAQPMTPREAGVSYVNIITSPYRQIHFHIPWLGEVIRSIAASVEPVILSGPQAVPQAWWIEG